MSTQLTIADLKNAMKDPSFISTLPASLNPEVQKFISNPNCGCSVAVFQKILKEAPEQVKAYFPTKDVSQATEQLQKAAANQPQISYPQQQSQPQMMNKSYIPNQTVNINELKATPPPDNFHVINCSIGEVEERLKKLPQGLKQIAMARYEDQVTIIVNIMDLPL